MSDILNLPVQHAHHGPVFVIGHARSGTSLLCSLMRRYLQISFGTESQFLMRVYRELPRYGDLRNERHLRRLVDDMSRERCFERWTMKFGFVLDKERVIQEASRGGRNYASVLHATFSQLAAYLGMERWGDKTPEYLHNLPVLLSLFPNAQFVHIVRDGRDVALSTFKMYFGASNAYRAAADWRRAILRINEFCSSLTTQQVLTIHYERLLEEPAETMGGLIDFLGIRNRGALQPVIVDDIPQQVRQDNSGKWEQAMTMADQRMYEAIAGDELRALGYPTPHRVERQLTVAERAFWHANHVLRKTLKTNYWSDTLYRAGTRVRTAAKGLRPSGASAWTPLSRPESPDAKASCQTSASR
jgi:hypothetical protein